MGYRFVSDCKCPDPLFRISEKGQAIRCDACDRGMIYESWGEESFLNRDELQQKKAPPIKPPAEGWRKSDDISFEKWFNSPDY